MVCVGVPPAAEPPDPLKGARRLSVRVAVLDYHRGSRRTTRMKTGLLVAIAAVLVHTPAFPHVDIASGRLRC